MDSSIRVNNLTVARQKKIILDSISIDIPAGTICGLLGPSGSGKTTLIRSIVGLQKITSGKIEVLGFAVGAKALRNLIGYSTQVSSIYGDLTCLENINFYLSLHPRSEQSAGELLEKVDLMEQAHQIADSLSGGERSRLSFASALVGTPKVLILDEPTVGLDPLLRREIWEVIRQLAADGVTILITSHVLDEAENCNQIILLRNGKILATGTPQALKRASKKEAMEEVFISLVEKR